MTAQEILACSAEVMPETRHEPAVFCDDEPEPGSDYCARHSYTRDDWLADKADDARKDF